MAVFSGGSLLGLFDRRTVVTWFVVDLSRMTAISSSSSRSSPSLVTIRKAAFSRDVCGLLREYSALAARATRVASIAAGQTLRLDGCNDRDFEIRCRSIRLVFGLSSASVLLRPTPSIVIFFRSKKDAESDEYIFRNNFPPDLTSDRFTLNVFLN